MTTVKVTFRLDAAAVERLASVAALLRKPRSEVVRDAILAYADRMDRLGHEDQSRLLAVFDEVVPATPPRPLADVDAELTELRRARRAGGRSAPA